MLASDYLRAVLVLLLSVATQVWHFYAILALISVFSSFFGPAQGVAIRSAVPVHGLRSANALMQQAMFAMRIAGPAVAAFLVASFGARSCYVLDSASFIASALLIASVPISKAAERRQESPTQSNVTRFWADTKDGIGFIMHHTAFLFVILSLASGMFVIGCFGPLIALYVRESLHGSTRLFGIASALIGVGMLIGTNTLNIFAKRIRSSTLIDSGLIGIAGGLLSLAGLVHGWSTLLSTFVIGFAVAGIVIPSQTMIQQETPAALMGRVGATVISVIFTAQISGLILSGILSGYIGVRAVFVGCAAVLAVLVTTGRVWMLRRGSNRDAGNKRLARDKNK